MILFTNKSDLRKCIKYEKKLLFSGIDRKGIVKYVITNNHLVEISKYQKFLRKENYYRHKKNIVSKMLELYYTKKKNKLGNKLGFYIGGDVFDVGLVLFHHGTIIVNGNAVVGKNCKLHGNNCIGNNGKDSCAPILGDNIDIGFGASIIGNVKLASNIKIGAGAVVTKSFSEEGITLVEVPAHKKQI